MPGAQGKSTSHAAALDVLRAYLEARASIGDRDFELILGSFRHKRLRAGEFLQRAGEITRDTAFVARGCLRSYVVDANGKEHIVRFAPEHWWLTDATSLSEGTPSTLFIDAIEDSDLLLIDGPSHDLLVERIASYATAYRTGLLRYAAAKQKRIVSALTASAEERYLEFLRVYPSIAVRVPQSMVASYLGMSPETLSRIRKKLSRHLVKSQ